MAIFRVPVRIDHSQPGTPAYNVWAVRTIGPSGDDEDQLRDAVDSLADFYTSLRTTYITGATITIGEGMIKDPLGSPEYVDDYRKTILSSGAGGQLPAMLSIVIGWRTSSATRSGRGRTFLGPFQANVNQSTNGTIDESILSTVRGATTGLLNDSTGPSGWSLGVLSTKQRLLRDFTGFTIKDRWSYLSSRRD